LKKKAIVRVLQLCLFAGGVLFLMSSCRTTEPQAVITNGDDGYYQNMVYTPLVREQIRESFKSVRRIQSNVIYKTYQFYLDDMPRESEIPNLELENIAAETTIDNHSTAGTGIVLSVRSRGVAILSASHTVTFADTIYHYSSEPAPEGNRYLEAISIKESLNQFIYADNDIVFMEMAVNDPRRDLAIMKTVSSHQGTGLRPLALRPGDSDELDWTDIIYAVGYPRGVQMVTQGTASRSEHPIRSIVLDISINRGFSGGAVFAVRNDGSGLEWVGMITSAMGEQDVFLVPEEIPGEEYNPDIPYTGDMFVKTKPRIYYGITNAVDIKRVREFINENREKIDELGLRVPVI